MPERGPGARPLVVQRADHALTDEDDIRFQAAYAEFEAADMGPNARERYLSLANTLADRCGVPRAEGLA